MSDYKARFVTEPIVVPLAQMALIPSGASEMLDWVQSRAPQCVPDEITESSTEADKLRALFPHDGFQDYRRLTDNELLVELAGRKCYDSFGLKAGRKDNASYIEHTQTMSPPHASITYHAKMSFFIAGVSRRVSHELIRNYVGADRTEEGAPSQQSTRYVENPGFYVTHPRYLDDDATRLVFEASAQGNYEAYRRVIDMEHREHTRLAGSPPRGIVYKRILEAASSLLLHSVETSFIWTTNPAALSKLFFERDNEAADLEFQRFARKWKRVCMQHWPNLFPAPHMKEGL